jgi:exopolysaccharide biosynthesis protein
MPWWGGGGCTKTSAAASQAGAIAAINGGFFDTATCGAMGMVKIGGQVHSYNSPFMEPQSTLGIDAADKAQIAAWPTDKDWPAVLHALGGHPNLVTDGAIDIWPDKAQSLYDDRHPRTAVGVTATGRLLLVTVDGRTSAGDGMTMEELAQYMIWLGADDAVNLDGGGSTTMWIEGMSINGIVNFPSDNQKADHWGERNVADGLLVLIE